MAAEYDTMVGVIASLFTKDAVGQLADYSRRHGAGAPNGKRLRALEVAAGTGALTLPLLQAGYDVEATDFSPMMLERLRENVKRVPPSPTAGRVLKVEVLNGEHLGAHADGSWDLICSSFGLIFFGERLKALQAAPYPLPRPRAFPDFALPAPTPDSPGPLSMADPAKVEADLKAAGWVDVEVRKVSHEVKWATREQLYNVAKDSPILYDAARKATGLQDAGVIVVMKAPRPAPPRPELGAGCS
eukprot:tig00001487_g8933.t1